MDQRRYSIAVIALLFFVYTGSSFADSNLAVLDKYYKDGHLDFDRIGRDYAAQHDKSKPQSKSANHSSGSQPKAQVASPAAPKAGAAVPVPQKPTLTLLLRQSFSDIWLFDQATPREQAQGATFSLSRDGVMHDTLWSVHGMTALVYSIPGDYSHDPGSPGVVGVTIAPYVQVDRETHSKLVTKNIDTVTAGGTGEIGFDNLFGGLQFFRARGAAVSDNVKGTTAFSAVGEWLPVYESLCIGYPCSVPGIPLIYRFQPELKLQYDDEVNGKPLLFSGRPQALRVGPEVSLVFKPFGPVWPILNNLSGKVTFHWDEELYSGRRFYWLDTSVTYNIDPQGYLGLTASYQRGRTEETGQLTDLYKLALSAKY